MDSNAINMTKDEVMALVSEIVGKSVTEAVKPLVDKNTQTRELIEAIRSASAGGDADSGEVKLDKNDAWKFVRAACAAKARSHEEVITFVRNVWKDAAMAKRFEMVCQRAVLAAGDAAAGGVLVPDDFSTQIIDLLRAKTVVRRLGAQMIDMPNGTIEVPKLTAGAAVGYVGENQARNATAPAFGNLTMTARKLVGIVPASNDLLRSPRANADSIIRTDLTRGIALREDLSFIRDDGTAGTPKGMKYWAASSASVASTGTSAEQIISDLSLMLSRIAQSNVDEESLAWIMTPRSREKLRVLRGTDVFLFRADIDAGRLMGHPLGATTQIPSNLGSGSDTEIYLVNMADALIGETGQMEVAASSEAAYNDESGNLVSPFSRDQSVVRVLERIDFALRHEESVQILTGVAW